MADAILHDPLGRKITLHDRTWDAHILKRHPELRGQRHLVEKAVTGPLKICFSDYDSDCRKYYGPGNRADVIMAVIVDVSLLLVKTAFFTRRTKGMVEWLPPTP